MEHSLSLCIDLRCVTVLRVSPVIVALVLPASYKSLSIGSRVFFESRSDRLACGKGDPEYRCLTLNRCSFS